MDDAKQAINQSMQGLSTRLHQVFSIAQQLQDDVATVQEGTQNLNDRTQQQAAAVEAARAGEHGRGFAVVASEVRNLAQKSANAAKDISTLVEQTARAIQIGVEQVDNVAQALDNITVETEKVQHIVAEVTQASKEQSMGIDEINKAIGHIDATTQQNAALVEETSATADSMTQSAMTLNQEVSRFKIAQTSQRLMR